jgi:predicted RNA-binding protein with PUA-like domain
MEIVAINVVDPTQFDPSSQYYDPKSSLDSPRWHTVTVGYLETFAQIVTLDQLKETFIPDELWVVRRGNRLSVMPIDDAIAEKLLQMAQTARV